MINKFESTSIFLSKKQFSCLKFMYKENRKISIYNKSKYITEKLLSSEMEYLISIDLINASYEHSISTADTFEITELGKKVFEEIQDNKKKMFWVDFRSWLAIAISIIAVIVGVAS